MKNDTTNRHDDMALLKSSSSHLMQLLDRTRRAIISEIQNDCTNKDETNEEDGNERIDIVALTEDIEQFTMVERGNELRDCARYNDYIILHTILYVTATNSNGHETLDSTPNLENDTDHHTKSNTAVLELLHSQDAYTGNTALHMAAANNHSNIVQFLLQIEQAIFQDIENCDDHHPMKPSSDTNIQQERTLRLVQRTNTSGYNTPLHYAVTNRALESIRYLLQDYSDAATSDVYTNPYIDVLQQNSAGRSSLTEAFALTSSSSSEQDTQDSADTKRNHEILTLLLEHPSANEERLIQSSSNNNKKSGKKEGTLETTAATEHATEQSTNLELPPCHTHHFRLVGNTNVYHNNNNNGIELYIREMAMAPPVTASDADNDTPAGTTTISKSENHNDLINILGGTIPMNDTTGYGIWSASIIMGQWMTDIFYNSTNTLPNETPIQTIVELGAGCGLPGITVAKSFVSRHEQSVIPKVYVTDLNPLTLQNLQHNVTTNHVDSIASVVSLDWNELINSADDKLWPWMVKATTKDESSEEEQKVRYTNAIDVLIGSDLVYQKEVVPILLQTIRKLRPRKFYYGAAGTNRDGHDLFIKSLQDGQMTLVSSFPAPSIYRTTNPLFNEDDDECFIHFQDLLLPTTKNGIGNNENGSDTFILYEFIAIGN